ncbi:GT2 family glycosyltransferase [Salirhabdus euzebyi]|uniref:GT2 family glycosyltransferase n=1 Tax=Salirhabdus euzebyi TaxID=394506 RepID=A0A841Q6P5_9BACI|nr:glycosyltransferase family 2 protein [Salirhabdus euzebyi]MBB6453997.1 GT2 family glycosyltransferase [Salirhabdus euzebyi]
MDKVDILLPIYNSYDDTKNCIESIMKNTVNGTYNLYLLDDNSPEENIKVLTSYYSDRYPFIISVRNKTNLGFPGNVNNGFHISENDVVVLNSDTIVTEGWLNKLIQVATSDEKIAAVNPMSNYGLISGLPTPNNEINDLFENNDIINAFNNNTEIGYVESPLLIGYCMYMKRAVLREIGDFDAETFKRGYGEESDWCMRARQSGYKLVVAKDAFVHHIGGVSFGAEKETLRNQSRAILTERYPTIDEDLKKFLKKNYFKKIRRGMMKELNFLKKQTSIKLKLKMIKHYLNNTGN